MAPPRSTPDEADGAVQFVDGGASNEEERPNASATEGLTAASPLGCVPAPAGVDHGAETCGGLQICGGDCGCGTSAVYNPNASATEGSMVGGAAAGGAAQGGAPSGKLTPNGLVGAFGGDAAEVGGAAGSDTSVTRAGGAKGDCLGAAPPAGACAKGEVNVPAGGAATPPAAVANGENNVPAGGAAAAPMAGANGDVSVPGGGGCINAAAGFDISALVSAKRGVAAEGGFATSGAEPSFHLGLPFGLLLGTPF
mmetsp:Transcript_20531/g.71044  ORF Transcript_20531/g.71044 Transcript_20531/m.71044 type:complete len:253 (+) Transcript_20531:686-1444(+)